MQMNITLSVNETRRLPRLITAHPALARGRAGIVLLSKLEVFGLSTSSRTRVKMTKEKTMSVKVINVNGTSSSICVCGSWLNHWSYFSGQSLPSLCSVVTCMHRPIVGAHVQKDSATDKSWYIVPLCKVHNDRTGDSLDIFEDIKLVSANVSETCDK
jgi:hypothetical protein